MLNLSAQLKYNGSVRLSEREREETQREQSAEDAAVVDPVLCGRSCAADHWDDTLLHLLGPTAYVFILHLCSLCVKIVYGPKKEHLFFSPPYQPELVRTRPIKIKISARTSPYLSGSTGVVSTCRARVENDNSSLHTCLVQFGGIEVWLVSLWVRCVCGGVNTVMV